MSQPMQVVYTHVNAYEREQINLEEIIGDDIPINHVMDVLRKEIFELENWTHDKVGNTYKLKIQEALFMYVKYTEEGNIIVTKEYNDRIAEELTTDEIEKLKQKSIEEFNIAFNKLTAKVYQSVLQIRIGESNVVRTTSQNNEIIIYANVTV